jgi:hypothetical protein
VTIIAGFQCNEGVLMCSDTEESISETSKSQVRKVPYFRIGKMTVAIGGAGDSIFVDYVTQDLAKYLANAPRTWKTLEDELKEYVRRIFREYVRPWSGFPAQFVPSAEFLIAVSMDGRASLFQWQRNHLHYLGLGNASIGIGTVLSQQIIAQIPADLPYNKTLFFAIRMMQAVKRLVPGCGGKTETIFLGHKGFITWSGTSKVEEIENLTDECDEFIGRYVLSFISDTQTHAPTTIDSMLESYKIQLKALREKYSAMRPEGKLNI